MQFVKADSPEPVAAHLTQLIASNLAEEKRVLWLLSGGSAVAVAVRVRQKLGKKTDGLTAMLGDERFGPPRHPDSNWQKLLDAGFDTNGIECHPTLNGKDLDTTVRDYEKALAAALDSAGFTVGLFGIGADGHTAGILPGSPAVNSQQMAAAYKGPDFERITMTPAAIAKCDAAVVYVAGEEKAAALEKLRQELPIRQQPAQALKRIKSFTIFTNAIVEEGNK